MIRNLILTMALITSFSFPDSKFDNVYENKHNLSNSTIYESSNLWNHNSSEEEKEEYLFFCNGIPCQHHDVKKVIKDISAEGRYIYYSSDELVDLDFSNLERITRSIISNLLLIFFEFILIEGKFEPRELPENASFAACSEFFAASLP